MGSSVQSADLVRSALRGNTESVQTLWLSSCGGINWPVRQTCEFCGNAEFAWEAMSGRGKVVSWCSFHQDYYAGILPRPYDCILVELAEGVLFLSNPSGFSIDDIELDMPVEVRFIDCEDGGGAFKLPVFARA